MSAKSTSRVLSSRVWLFHFFLSTLLSFLPHRNSFSLVFKLPAVATSSTAAAVFSRLHAVASFPTVQQQVSLLSYPHIHNCLIQ
ncbi:hypothetical protein WN944_025238 [Citrus x changshan-huyou]|uniref:Uncharacterized protein n=1 Tax=Citrus x changshan-huyou TaxID=2935761 RepID=A0AAP0LQ18_9ROSI